MDTKKTNAMNASSTSNIEDESAASAESMKSDLMQTSERSSRPWVSRSVQRRQVEEESELGSQQSPVQQTSPFSPTGRKGSATGSWREGVEGSTPGYITNAEGHLPGLGEFPSLEARLSSGPGKHPSQSSQFTGVSISRPFPNDTQATQTPPDPRETCPYWARGKCHNRSEDCRRAHYYFPTVVFRSRPDAQQIDKCQNWASYTKTIPSEYVPPEMPPGSEDKKRLPACAFSAEACAEAHERLDYVVSDRRIHWEKIGELPYAAVVLLKCKKCDACFSEVADVELHVEEKGHR